MSYILYRTMKIKNMTLMILKIQKKNDIKLIKHKDTIVKTEKIINVYSYNCGYSYRAVCNYFSRDMKCKLIKLIYEYL